MGHKETKKKSGWLLLTAVSPKGVVI